MRWVTCVAVVLAFFPGQVRAVADGDGYPKQEVFINGTYPAHVRAGPCQKPVYFEGGYLQGWAYAPGYYCFDPKVLTIKPYVPGGTVGTPVAK